MKTRQHLITAAEQALETQGLARVTVRDIARAAGYADGTLYNHFEDKDTLVLAVIEENLPDFVAVLTRIAVGQATVAANLAEIAAGALAFYAKILPLLGALFADPPLLARHRAHLLAQQKGPQRAYELVAAYLEGEQRLGRVGPRVPPLGGAALLLGACFQYAFLRHFLAAPPLPLAEAPFVGQIITALLAGLAPE